MKKHFLASKQVWRLSKSSQLHDNFKSGTLSKSFPLKFNRKQEPGLIPKCKALFTEKWLGEIVKVITGKRFALFIKEPHLITMKYLTLYAAAFMTLCLSSCDVQSQNNIGNILKNIPVNGTPTNLEIGAGLKQALEFGTSAGADQLSAKDGFFGNLAIKILFPPEAQKVEKTLRGLGLNSLADNVILSLNRAAEDAAKEAKPIFVAAIRQMTIADAANILLSGNKDAATQYFKRVTTAQLMEKFRPVITSSLSKVGATRYWGDAATAYNKIPLVKPVETDLSSYVAQKAIDGMFVQVAKEELKIRDNINARSTPLLQKVFGYADTRR